MGIALGFGSVEKQEREKIKGAVIGALANGESVYDVLSHWNERAKEYDNLPRGEAPQRYTRIYYHPPLEERRAKLVYHHINREHAFSPDGWAVLRIEEKLGAKKEPTP